MEILRRIAKVLHPKTSIDIETRDGGILHSTTISVSESDLVAWNPDPQTAAMISDLRASGKSLTPNADQILILYLIVRGLELQRRAETRRKFMTSKVFTE